MLKTCRRLLPFLLLGLVLGGSGLVQASGQDSEKDLTARIDKLLSDVYKPGHPGAAVLVKKHGNVILRKGYGLANLELNVPVEPDMIFRLGSVTKQFTAVAVLMLAEEGKLSLQDEITKFVPDYPTQGKKITVEHLLTHTSGIKSYTDLPEWLSLQRKDMTVAEVIDLAKDKPMEFAPGERWKYCNSGYILLGAIIEKASGKTYAEFLESRVFSPLGMKSTLYDSTSRVVPGRVSGYTKGKAGYENAPYLSMSQPYAAGSLASSVDDLATWTESLLAGKLVKRETLERAFTPYVLKDGLDSGYGYGWFISRYEGHRLVEHGGGIHGFLSYAMFFPEDEVFVALLVNSTVGELRPDPLAFRAACLALGVPYKEPAAISLPEAELETLTGVYVNAHGEELFVTREESKLFAQAAGGGKSEIRPVSPTEFYYTDSPARAQFRKDEKGAVVGLRVMPRIGPVRSFTKTAKPLPAGRQEVKLDPALYDKYVGEYELAPGFVIIITRENDKLMGEATGQPKVELFPESETKFFLKVVDGQVEFIKGEAGEITGLVLVQGGQRLPGKKVK